MKEMNTDETTYCTVAEAARLLRVSAPTVWRWVDSGRLPAYRIGGRAIRIRRSDLSQVVRPARRGLTKGLIMERQVIYSGDQTIAADELVKRLRATQGRLLARRSGKRLAPSEEIIRRAREERAAGL